LEKRREQVLPGSERGGERGRWSGREREEVAQTMYTHMNKCINNKRGFGKRSTFKRILSNSPAKVAC
jgi:hypothetical protein